MAWGRARLAGAAAGALGRIAADRVREPFGGALPRTPEQLARPDPVDALLRGSPPAAGTLPRVRSVERVGGLLPSSNCTNFVVRLGYESPQADGAPETLYVKMPCPELATRVFGNAIGFWEIECWFCERLAHRVPIRVPRVHAVARQGARFVLLLENLTEIPGVRLFVNRDMAEGTSVERARRCLSTFAELHAAFWDASPAEREELLPLRLHPWLSPRLRDASRALNASSIGPARSRAPDLFPASAAAACRMAIDKWEALVDFHFASPLTLVHGDSHLGNCFELPGEDGVRVGMIDFQGVHWGPGIRDVQYFLANSVEPGLLAESEAELVDHYRAELAGRLGARGLEAPSREQLLERYRASSFQTLMVAVVSLGLGSLTETDDTVRTVLRRSVAAVERLRLAEWLEALPTSAG